MVLKGSTLTVWNHFSVLSSFHSSSSSSSSSSCHSKCAEAS